MIYTPLIIIEQFLLHVPLVFGAYISFSLMKVTDLSIETAYVTGALCGTYALQYTSEYHVFMQLLCVIFASLLGGLIVGFTSSFLTQFVKISHLLSNIITFGLYYGLLHYLGAVYITLNGFNNPLYTSFIARHPELITCAIIGVIVIGGVGMFLRTQLGYACAVYGINRHFFKHYAINARFVFMMGIMVANMLAGLSGYLFAQSNGFVEINMGLGKSLLCLTALILGRSLPISKRMFHISIPFFGCLFYFILQQMLLKVGFNLKYFTTVQAVVVLLIIIISQRQSRVSSDINQGGI